VQSAQNISKHFDRKEKLKKEKRKKDVRKRALTCYSVVCFFFSTIFLCGITFRDIIHQVERVAAHYVATSGRTRWHCVRYTCDYCGMERSRTQGCGERGEKGCVSFVDPDAPLRGLTLFNPL